MTTTTLDKLIWILIYGSLIGVALGLSVQRTDAVLGWAFVACGGVVAFVGALLVVVRARMKADPP